MMTDPFSEYSEYKPWDLVIILYAWYKQSYSYSNSASKVIIAQE